MKTKHILIVAGIALVIYAVANKMKKKTGVLIEEDKKDTLAEEPVIPKKPVIEVAKSPVLQGILSNETLKTYNADKSVLMSPSRVLIKQ
jgi:hypothetical protein